MVCDQCYAAADPVAYDAATAWMNKIDGPDTSYTNGNVSVMGSAWIDWASAGTGWMNFQNYSVWFQPQGTSGWTKVVCDSALELHHANLVNWNTIGLTAGNYNLKLTGRNNFGDTIEAIKPITLLPGVVGIKSVKNEVNALYPNPSAGQFIVRLADFDKAELEILNVIGQKVHSQRIVGEYTNVNISDLSDGVYFARVTRNGLNVYSARLVKD
jgi:hypothetical protein